ncbi:MAG: hypothetical protein H6594_02010 [Flavobacteriales bacterium]|nr:hypothetical protein [Flavobacteriales bacterium]
MNTRTMACALLLGACGAVNAQWWNTVGGNTINTTTQYLGCDGSSTQPLRLKTEVNYPIEWYTDALRRMRLQETATYTIGSFSSLVRDGSLLLSPDVDLFYTNGGPGPFSLLHLADGTGDNSQDLGFRPWMRNGITFTGNSDQGYIGQKYTYYDPEDEESGERPDYTDMVVQWSDNPGTWLSDRMPQYC